MSMILLITFCIMLLTPIAYSTQWFEDFEDQSIATSSFIEDTGDTAWNATATSASADYHGIQTKLGTKAFYMNDVDSTFITEMINASNSTSNIDVSFIVAVTDDSNEFGGNDEVTVFIRPNGGIPILADILELNTIDNNGNFEAGHIINFETTYKEFNLEIRSEVDSNDKHLIIDNILIEWVSTGETASNNTIDVTNNFNATVISNTNQTVFVNNTVIVNAEDSNDTFEGFVEIEDLTGGSCPLSDGSTDKDFFMFMLFMSIILFAIAFWIDNAIIGIIASILIMFMAFVTFPCSLIISILFGFLGLVALVLSTTQMSLSAS